MSDQMAMTPRLIAIKRATREAVEAAGGLEFCEGQTRAGKSQLARSYSRNHDDSITVRDAVTLDDLAMSRGGPFILRAMARQLGCAVIVLPDVEADDTGIARSFLTITGEMGDVARKVDAALRDGIFEPHEAQGVLCKLDGLIEHAVAFRHLVEGFAHPKNDKVSMGSAGNERS